MRVIEARNVNDAYGQALRVLKARGALRESRAGPVLVHPGPVTTAYKRPLERVLFDPARDANPFFHLFEVLWMLAGRADVEWLSRFNSNIAKVASDDGVTLHGAYGRRWRWHWGTDQLRRIGDGLRANPDCRRQVLQAWDPTEDLGNTTTKDVPCNVAAAFQVNPEGAVDLTVFCRSNDIVWGCYGSDAVTFGTLLEYVAALAGRPAGRYWQVSVNWHGYVATLPEPNLEVPCPYETGMVEPVSLVRDPATWDAELKVFMDVGADALGYREPFFRRVAVPMLAAWDTFKRIEAPGRYDVPIGLLSTLEHDWALAARQWLERRRDKWLKTK